MQGYVDKIRDFNRYYTNALGLLDTKFLDSRYSLTEARLLYEIGNTSGCTASHLSQLLNIDKGYLSRILKQFERDSILIRKENKLDTRILNLRLSKKGRRALLHLNEASNAQITGMIESFSDSDRGNLVGAMDSIRHFLSQTTPSFVIRESMVGDLGYIIYRHAVLYEEEYKFNRSFEEYVIHGISDYLKARVELDRIWIAEIDDQIVGAIAIIHTGDKTAQLRWFYTEPRFRNLGIGKKLLTTALAYSREHFSQLSLWTLSNLPAARSLYKQFQFILTDSKSNQVWNSGLMEEKWELKF